MEPTVILDLPSCKQLSTADNLASVQSFIIDQAEKCRPKRLIYEKGPSKNTSSKILVDSSSFNGCFGFYEIAENIYLAFTDVLFRKKQVFNFIGENWVRFHFRVSGSNSIVMKDLDQYEMSGSFAEMSIHPQGVDRFEFFFPNKERHFWITIFCTTESLEEKLGIELDALTSAMGKVINTSGLQYRAEKTVLSGAMCSAVHDLASVPLAEDVLDVYRKSKVAELVCLIIDALGWDNRKNTPKIKIRRRDADRLHEVRKRLMQDAGLALNLGRLVRETGLNRNKLTYGFKEMFGMTMSDFCKQQRFIRARELLIGTDMSISEIAFITGYSNVSNFSNAFKSYYGFSPKRGRLDIARKSRRA